MSLTLHPMTPTATMQATSTQTLRGVRREHMYSKYPRANVTKQMVMDMVKEYEVQFIDMQFTDMDGVLKAVTLPVHKLEDGIDNNVWFDGSSISGFTVITE